MKKTLALILLMVAVGFAFPTVLPSVSATVLTDRNTATDYWESFAFETGDFRVNQSPITGIQGSSVYPYLPLLPNGTTLVTFLSGQLYDQFSHPNGFELSEVYVLVRSNNLTASNVSVNCPSDLVSKSQTESNNGVSWTATDFVYNLNVNSLSDYFVLGFNYTTDTPAREVLINSATMYVHYTVPANQGDPLDLGIDYTQLPENVGSFVPIRSFTPYDSLTHSYDVSMVYDGTEYRFKVSIPNDVYNQTFMGSEIGNRVAFTEIPASQMAYYTAPDGSKCLYIQPDSSLAISSGTMFDPQIVSLGSIILNLSDMTYFVTDKLDLVSVTEKDDYFTAYMYCFYPMPVQEIVLISFQYQYRIHLPFRVTDWFDVSKTVYSDDMADVTTAEYMYTYDCYGLMTPTLYVTNSTSEKIQSIESITPTDIPTTVMTVYTNELGKSVESLDSLNLYKIYLGQFDENPETADDFIKWPWNEAEDFDIQNLVVNRLVYVYQGIVYEAPISVMDQENYTPPVVDYEGWWSDLTGSSWWQNSFLGDITAGVEELKDGFLQVLNVAKWVVIGLVSVFALVLIVRFVVWIRQAKTIGDIRKFQKENRPPVYRK